MPEPAREGAVGCTCGGTDVQTPGPNGTPLHAIGCALRPSEDPHRLARAIHKSVQRDAPPKRQDPVLAQLVERERTRRVWLRPLIGGSRWTLILAREGKPR